MSDESPEPRWDEPEQPLPWDPADGPGPRVTTYPHGHTPILRALVDGKWRRMTVRARHDYPDGRVAYQGTISLPDSTGDPGQHYDRVYWWPQPGRLRIALRPE